MKTLALLILLTPSVAWATVYNYQGPIHAGAYDGLKGASFYGYMALSIDADARTWTMDTSFPDPDEFGMDLTGSLTVPRQLGTWGPFQIDPVSGDFRLTSDGARPSGLITLHGTTYNAYVAGDFLCTESTGAFYLFGVHTTIGGIVWDYSASGAVTVTSDSPSSVPEPLTAALLALVPLVRRRR